MAGLENLVSSIYHEKQQEGSMLCAQHALNNLLQGNYFTAPDLSHIASNLDALEHSYDGDHTGSTNMDDTGFFSVQVLEDALTVWGLNLTRWRGEEMRPYQDHPQTQLAFILNLEQHWFTLRRFGRAESNINNDSGDGHWFNLNSSLPEPEWVGQLYLGMVLQQAETDGYSVFAVTQVDPFAPLGLPRTVADQIASTLPEPTSSNPRPPSNRPLAQTSMHEGRIEGLEDEDYELQAALQASLMGDQFGASDPGPPAPPRLTRSFAPLPPDDSELFEQSSSRPPAATRAPADDEEDQDMDEEGEEQLDPEHGDVDPVAASMARSRLMLQRMTAHQEYAQRELWGEGSLSEADAAALEARRAERQREEQEEAEELRRAIAESEALARVEGHAPRTDDDDEESDVMNVDRPGPDPLQGFHPAGGRGVGDRVYDDDDADLQAALKASLEHVPQGWEFPELPSQPAPSHPTSVPVRVAPDPTTQTESDKDTEGAESVLSTEGEVQDHPSSNAPVDDVSVDELRRRRLARFGM